ncbi:hypothetical protein BSKO_12660 [Bryopsis sp. KO-2023]|nr:hypothetical protein BSKO_12660 [Bryopsis sp. KO-2023]
MGRVACGYGSDPGILGKRSERVAPVYEVYNEAPFVGVTYQDYMTKMYAKASRRKSRLARKQKKSSQNSQNATLRESVVDPSVEDDASRPQGEAKFKPEEMMEAPDQEVVTDTSKQEEKAAAVEMQQGTGYVTNPAFPQIVSPSAFYEGCAAAGAGLRAALVRELVSRMMDNLSLASVFSYLQEQHASPLSLPEPVAVADTAQGGVALEQNTLVTPPATPPPTPGNKSKNSPSSKSKEREPSCDENNPTIFFRRGREGRHDRRPTRGRGGGRGRYKNSYRGQRDDHYRTYYGEQSIGGEGGRRVRRGHDN